MVPTIGHKTKIRANFGRWQNRVLPSMVEHFNGRSTRPEFPRLSLIDFSMCAMCRREDRRPGREQCQCPKNEDDPDRYRYQGVGDEDCHKCGICLDCKDCNKVWDKADNYYSEIERNRSGSQ